MGRARSYPGFLDAYWSKVSIPDDPSRCWLWAAALNGPVGKGYGVIWGRNSKGAAVKFYAHRLAWELAHADEIPGGLLIDHLCRTRHCVNPAHLEVVTARVNLLRGDSPAAKHSVKTHCPNGHPYDERNTYHVPGRNIRQCITCNVARKRAAYQLTRSSA